MSLSERDKLRIVLSHWIDHNLEHAAEFRRWVDTTDEARADIQAAAAKLEEANKALEAALETLGGPLEQEHRHHHGRHEH